MQSLNFSFPGCPKRFNVRTGPRSANPTGSQSVSQLFNRKLGRAPRQIPMKLSFARKTGTSKFFPGLSRLPWTCRKNFVFVCIIITVNDLREYLGACALWPAGRKQARTLAGKRTEERPEKLRLVSGRILILQSRLLYYGVAFGTTKSLLLLLGRLLVPESRPWRSNNDFRVPRSIHCSVRTESVVPKATP